MQPFDVATNNVNIKLRHASSCVVKIAQIKEFTFLKTTTAHQ